MNRSGHATKLPVKVRHRTEWRRQPLARTVVVFLASFTAAVCFAFVSMAEPQQGQQPPQGQAPVAAQPVAPAAQPAAQSQAPAQSAGQAGQKTEFRPRLPMYYAKVVDEKQRQKIYEIQRKYHPQIVDLQKQLEKLIAQRDAEIEAVLTPQQKAEIEKLRQEASQRRKEKSEAGPPAEANSPSQQ